MEQDWLTATLKFIRLNLGFLILAIGFCIVFAWGGYRVSKSFFAPSNKVSIHKTVLTPDEQVLKIEPSPIVQPSIAPLVVAAPKPTEIKQPEVVKENISTDSYTVRAGDSTSKIAQKLWGNGKLYPAIEKANNFKHNKRLSLGQKLTIPAKPSEKIIGKITSGKSVEVIGGKVVDTTFHAASISDVTMQNYTIKSGDCLWTIAATHLTSPYRWIEIYKLNKALIGSNPNLIYPGTVLKLPQH